MKIYKKISILFFLFSYFCFGIKVESVFPKSNLAGFNGIKSYKNTILTCKPYEGKINNSRTNYMFYYDGNSWTTLLDSSGFNPGGFDFDKDGNIWATGSHALWRYENHQWQKFFINDSFAQIRDYGGFCIDSSGNIWVSTFIGIIDKQDGGTTLYKECYYELLNLMVRNLNI